MELIIPVILLGIAGYYDAKLRMIPDIVSSFLWLWLCFYPAAYIWAVVTFALALISNSANVMLYKKAFLAWGDILILPPYIALFSLLLPLNALEQYIGIAGFVAPLLLTARYENKIEIPAALSYFIAAGVGVALSLIA